MTGLKTAAAAYAGMVGLFLASGVAIAQAPMVVEAELPRAVVSYADLDLRSAAGEAKLRARVESAAAQLCLHDGTLPLTEQKERARCFREAMASAEAQIAHAAANEAIRLAGRRTIEVALRK
jgi:UrcA family protein